MSDHVWVQERAAAYLAGGLDAQEAERLEAHARDCPACGTVLADARRLDGGLSALFAGAHPDAGLEDRTVARLRTPASPAAWPSFNPRAKKWAVALAAMLLLGVVGALAEAIASKDGLRMPGSPMVDRAERELAEANQNIQAKNRAKAEQAAGREQEQSLRDQFGVDSNIQAALPDIERTDRRSVDEKVTQDNVKSDPAFTGDKGTSPNRSGASRSPTWSLPPSLSVPPPVPTGPVPTVVPASISVPPPPSFDPVKSRPEIPTDPEPRKPGDPKAEPGVPQPKAPGVDPKNPEPNAEPLKRIIVRSGDMEFEIESFDSATAAVTKLVLGIKGAFVATVNSDKLTNGKVKGAITVRVPPDQLDGLVLDLRRELGKGGELKGVKLTSQDVTKLYTDLEARARAARTMETRLLQIIKEGKGEIEQLLKAEKEVGVWRTKVEELEGEIRYYANLAAFSTLTISLTEKEIRAAAAITERERVQAGVEVEDVDKAYQQVLAAVVEAKGRITKSELKQLSAGQFNATFNFEVSAESGGPIRDRLRMLGRVARLEIDRTVQTEGGTLPSDVKTTRGDTVFLVQLYNLANISPRETAAVQVAVADVPLAYQALRDAVAKTTGRVLVAQLNEQDRQNITAQFDFEVKRTDEAAVRAALDAAGTALSRQIARAAESDSVTDSKVMYKVTLLSVNRLKPRETATLQIAVTDVPNAYQTIRDAVSKATGRVLVAQLNEQDRQNISAELEFEVKRTDEGAVRAALDAAGDVLSRQVGRAAETDGATDSKVLYKVALVSASRLNPRETTTLSVEVTDVDGTATRFATQVAEAKGRQVDAKLDRDAGGRATAKLVFEVPLAAAPELVQQFKAVGTVRVSQSIHNPQATEGRYATARIHVTLTNVEAIVPEGNGLWSKVRHGLSLSASVLLTSVTWVVFGLCVILPWAVIGFGGYRVVRRFVQPAAAPALAPAVPPV